MRSVLGALVVLSLGLILFPGFGEVWILLLLVGAAGFGIASKGGAVEGLRALDDIVYAGERLLVAISLVVMAFFVFLDVVWRTAHSVEGATAYGFPIAIFLLCLLGGYTTRWSVSLGMRLAAGVGMFGALAAGTALVYQAPNGFGWSQTLALALIIWVGLLGGSMATREGRHIAVDAVKRVIPVKLKRAFEIAAGSATVLLATVLAVLGTMYARGNYVDWVGSEYRAFLWDSLGMPYWAATVSIPIGFGLMAVRFLGVAIFGAKEVDLLTSVGAGGGDEELSS
ncbi:MAG: TRAP transporter small permease subunit [Deltaproteobacteria bacterium]|jgi:TRAP-type C4-dicarboxylate transport system permease small subunit